MATTETATKSLGTAKIAGLLVLVFGVTLLTMYLINKPGGSTAASAVSVDQGQQDVRVAPSTKPAMGVEIPTLQFKSDVQKYMRDCLNAPIPKGYHLPEVFDHEENYDFAVMKVGEHFPEFRDLEGDALVKAAWDNPFKYQAMILEAKSVREKFFPGSQPKVPE